VNENNLTVVQDQCKFADDMSAGTIVIESSNPNLGLAIEELGSMDARNLATKHASMVGMADPRINGNTGSAYPINAKGESVLTLTDGAGQALPPQHPDKQPVKYRADIPVCRKLV
jgi:hypothetical protein